MSDYRIKLDVADLVARQAIDLAVHEAIHRFADELGDHRGLAHRIARVAAANAMDQFRTWCNSELRLIYLEHERRAEAITLKPPRFVEMKPTP